MEERVGDCARCGKAIVCRDGFLEGITRDDGELICFGCDESPRPKEEAEPGS